MPQFAGPPPSARVLLTLVVLGATAATGGCAGGSASAAPSAPPSRSSSAAERASARVAEFYLAYLADPEPSVAIEYFDPTMLSTLFGAPDTDPVVCAQNLPTSVSVSTASVNPPTATVRVTTARSGGPRLPITVTLRLSDLQVVGIACPA